MRENRTSVTRTQVTAPSFPEGAPNKSKMSLHSPCLHKWRRAYDQPFLLRNGLLVLFLM
jgi:hypothetical protein